MRASARRRVVIAAIGSTLLSGCWLFPPFMPPLDPGTRTYVVENATDTDWVLELRSDVPTIYAIPAGESGTVEAWGAQAEAIALVSADCETVDELEAGPDLTAIRITDPGALAEHTASAEELEPFAEYWDCPGAFTGEPVGVTPLAGATGTILAFGGDSLLYRFSPADGTLEAAFPSNNAAFFDMEHALSPDGTQVAFARSGMSSTDIYVAAADGSAEEIVAEQGTTPIWSPDGSQLAYIDAGPFARSSAIRAVDLATGETRVVAEDGGYMSWSPDGTRIAYIEGSPWSPDLESSSSEVHVVDADGSNDRVIGLTPPYSYAPAWSPDAAQVAYASVADEELDVWSYESTIAVFDLDSGALTTVAEIDASTLAEPAWSPDGSRIAFSLSETTLFAGSGSVGIVDAGGGPVTRLADDEYAIVGTPTWSPDGAWIAASAQQSSGDLTSVLVALDPDDPAAVPIILVTDIYALLSWR